MTDEINILTEAGVKYAFLGDKTPVPPGWTKLHYLPHHNGKPLDKMTIFILGSSRPAYNDLLRLLFHWNGKNIGTWFYKIA